ncbi:hypothetical protein E2C01_071606 [Portunus trituberculatus]|uniref:RRM domain-containing protein n=1 Tax=Portunus trituberculatus TaxID=210409 RepID=A0A5B7I5K1_PORTR|nr:hypothetical protein [Portunus trituberculatus]
MVPAWAASGPAGPPAGGVAKCGPSCAGWMGVRAGMLWEGGLSSVVDEHSCHVGPFFLERLVREGNGCPVRSGRRSLTLWSQWRLSGSREVAGLARERSSSGLDGREDSPPREPPAAVSCSGSSSERRFSAAYDSLMMMGFGPSFSCRALHSLLGVCGAVLRIRLVCDKDFPSSRCCVTFLSCDEARLAYEHVASLPLAGSGFGTGLLHSRSVSDSGADCIPGLFDHHFESSVSEVRRIPPPRWFVAYYGGGRGNFIHASRYLSKEIGTIPEGNLKKYGKGVLVRAKDITQAKTLQHLPCPSDSMFETIKAHPHL